MEDGSSSPTTMNLLMRTYTYIYAFRERITRAIIFFNTQSFLYGIKVATFLQIIDFSIEKIRFLKQFTILTIFETPCTSPLAVMEVATVSSDTLNIIYGLY